MSTIVVEKREHQTADPCFTRFWAEWSEYILELTDMTEAEVATGYRELLTLLREKGSFELWRGMSVSPGWLGMWSPSTSPLGVYWTEERYISESFETAISVCDERFTWLENTERPGKLLLRARVTFDAVDVAATIATQLASAEAEVRLKPESVIELLEVHLDGNCIFEGVASALA